MNTLQELAERCEKATAPDRELDEAIMAAVFRREDRMIGTQEEQNDGSWKPIATGVWVDPETDRWVSTGPHEFTSSIDAAMTLVPRGHSADTQQRKRIHNPPAEYIERAWAQIETLDGTEFLGNSIAVSLPLAISAAALRARAATPAQSSKGE